MHGLLEDPVVHARAGSLAARSTHRIIAVSRACVSIDRHEVPASVISVIPMYRDEVFGPGACRAGWRDRGNPAALLSATLPD